MLFPYNVCIVMLFWAAKRTSLFREDSCRIWIRAVMEPDTTSQHRHPQQKKRVAATLSQTSLYWLDTEQNIIVSSWKWTWVGQRNSFMETRGVFSLGIDWHGSLKTDRTTSLKETGKPFFVLNWITALEEIFLIPYLIFFLFSRWYYLRLLALLFFTLI